MRKSLYIFCVWTATLLMMLSTVVMHHHHYERTCIDSTHCTSDTPLGNDADANGAEEAHNHQESGNGCCRIYQLHNFIVSTGTAKDIHRNIVRGGMFFTAVLPNFIMQPIGSSLTVARWQHTATPLSLRAPSTLSLRGPPTL